MRPRVFIGSSSEGLYAAEYIKHFFSADYDCVIWNEDVFKFNKSFLETLLKSASLFDFGFLIFTKDDVALSRDIVFETARDNVIFEYGLFLGRLGVDRAFVVIEEGTKIPSDFMGYSLTQMKTEKGTDGKAKIVDAQFAHELGKLKLQIDDYVRLGHLGLLPSTVIAISYFENFVKLVADWLSDNVGVIPCGDKTYKSAKLKVVIPSNLDADIKKRAAMYYRRLGLSESSFQSRGRSYPVHMAEVVEGEQVVIYDMPSILNGIDKAIDMYFRVGHIGKTVDQQFAEDHGVIRTRVLLLLPGAGPQQVQHADDGIGAGTVDVAGCRDAGSGQLCQRFQIFRFEQFLPFHLRRVGEKLQRPVAESEDGDLSAASGSGLSQKALFCGIPLYSQQVFRGKIIKWQQPGAGDDARRTAAVYDEFDHGGVDEAEADLIMAAGTDLRTVAGQQPDLYRRQGRQGMDHVDGLVPRDGAAEFRPGCEQIFDPFPQVLRAGFRAELCFILIRCPAEGIMTQPQGLPRVFHLCVQLFIIYRHEVF